MNDDPEWIRKIEQEEEAKKQEVARIEAEGPRFWKQLLKKLEIAAAACKHIGVRASVSNIGGSPNTSTEEAWHVLVAAGSRSPAPTYTNLFYRNGGAAIRCHTLEGRAFTLDFRLDPQGTLGVIASDPEVSVIAGVSTMGPKDAAQFILQPMVRRVKQ